MILQKLYPDYDLEKPELLLQGMLRNVLIQTNFVPGVRHVIGWRGLKDSSLNVDAWTARIRDLPGIFGIYYNNMGEKADWINGQFFLNYFPNPKEDVVEQFSLPAGISTQQEDYYEYVRDFLLHPDMCNMFNVGIINLSINRSGKGFMMNLESLSRQRIIALDGIIVQNGDEKLQLVQPGGYDQDLPSYSIAFTFFHVLATSFAFNVQDSPVFMKYSSQVGTIKEYDASGNTNQKQSDDIREENFSLGFGEGDFNKLTAELFPEKKPMREDLKWTKGQDIPEDYADLLWWNASGISDYGTLDKNALGIDDRPHLIVLTGFLGSGKTSFLQHFIEYQAQMNRFVAIIQNEIGEVGLDGKIMGQDYAVTEMDEGCVCCTLVGNLKGAIHGILSEFQPDYIILETTGLANPFNLKDELIELEELVRFDSITTVVDGANIEKSIDEYEVAKNQLSAADVILLNKKDLIPDEKMDDISKLIRQYNPNAPLVTSTGGYINPGLLYGVDPNETSEIKSETNDDLEHLDCVKTDKDHEHHHHSHEFDCLSSVKVDMGKSVNHDAFIEKLENMPPAVFRIKGIVDFSGMDTSMLVQFVGGRYELSEYNNPNFNERFLTVIGQNLNENFSVNDFHENLY